MDALLNTAIENQLLAALSLLAFLLLLVVTVGVGYLTAVEWRDRRRRGRDADITPTLKRKLK